MWLSIPCSLEIRAGLYSIPCPVCTHENLSVISNRPFQIHVQEPDYKRDYEIVTKIYFGYLMVSRVVKQVTALSLLDRNLDLATEWNPRYGDLEQWCAKVRCREALSSS